MRVIDEVELAGEFWLPATPTRKVAGRLSISNGGKVRVEVIGTLRDFAGELTGGYELARVIGQVEKFGLVTLDNCHLEGRSLTPGISTATVVPQFAFLGAAYDDGEVPAFNSYAFEADGLDDWHGISGLKVDAALQENSASIVYRRPDKVPLWRDGEWTLELRFGWQLPAFGTSTHATISQTSKLYLHAATARPLHEFAGYAHQLTHLLTLACDHTVAIRNVVVTVANIREGGEGGDQYEKPIRLFYESLSFTEQAPEIRPFDFLFRLHELSPDSQSALSAWFRAHQRLGPSMNLYFSAKAGIHRFLDSQFLAFAQALESYHRRTSDTKVFGDAEFEQLRWALLESTASDYRDYVRGRLTNGNEPSLSARLKELIAPYHDLFGSEKDRKSLVARIVAARNHYIHFPPAKSPVADGADLWALCGKMDALFRLILMAELGFSPEQLRSVARDRHRLRDALHRKL